MKKILHKIEEHDMLRESMFDKTEAHMKISYKKLWVMLIQREITKVQLRADVGISAGTMSKLNKGEDVALSVLLRICDYLNCDIGDICEAVRTGKD